MLHVTAHYQKIFEDTMAIKEQLEKKRLSLQCFADNVEGKRLCGSFGGASIYGWVDYYFCRVWLLRYGTLLYVHVCN